MYTQYITQSTVTTCSLLSVDYLTHTHTAFVKGDRPDSFPGLEVRYKKGANPTLKLLDETRTVQDTLA